MHLVIKNRVRLLPSPDVMYLQREQHRDNVKVHPEGSDLCDPVGCLQQHRVIDAPYSLLMVEDPPLVEVLLGEGVCHLCANTLEQWVQTEEWFVHIRPHGDSLF